MTSDNVTVVDQYGNLLSKPENDPNSALTEKQLTHRLKIEKVYREKILLIDSKITIVSVNIDGKIFKMPNEMLEILKKQLSNN